MEEIKCIFCDIDSNQVVINENGYEGKKCSRCGLIYISPRPSKNDIVDLYGHDRANISAEAHIASDFSRRLNARHNLRIISSVVKNGDLLEIGAGAGYFLDEARKFGLCPYALEFNPIQANFIRNNLNIPCEESPLSTSVFEGKKFDAVYHCDVISHLFDPISDFRTISEILKDQSYLIFETGNFGEVDQRYFKYIQQFQYPDHLFFFSTDNLKSLLDRTGFEVLKIYRYSILPQLFLMHILAGIKQLLTESNGMPAKSENSKNAREIAGDFQQPYSRESIVKSVARNILQYINYLLRYSFGFVAPKKCQPQTVIFVAQKRRAE